MKPLTLGAGHMWILMSQWRMNVKFYMKYLKYWTVDFNDVQNVASFKFTNEVLKFTNEVLCFPWQIIAFQFHLIFHLCNFQFSRCEIWGFLNNIKTWINRALKFCFTSVKKSWLLYITSTINNSKVKALQHQNDSTTVKIIKTVIVSMFQNSRDWSNKRRTSVLYS